MLFLSYIVEQTFSMVTNMPPKKKRNSRQITDNLRILLTKINQTFIN